MIEDTLILRNSEHPMLTIHFGVPVRYTEPGSISASAIAFSGSTVTCSADNLTSVSTDFDIVLDVCDLAPGDNIGVWTDYFDTEDIIPDLSLLDALVIGESFCESATGRSHKPLHKPSPQTPPHALQMPLATLRSAIYDPWLLFRRSLEELP